MTSDEACNWAFALALVSGTILLWVVTIWLVWRWLGH